ncbi:MAG TPA: twin-arginine translocase subunit TatC, partial [Chloroflexi bacterium]|nr:twin-arginine translocase subunit TatC [Chloroflexota bacterium]
MSDTTMTSHDVEMSIWEHLNELRSRLLRVVIALVVATLISVVFTEHLINILLVPMGDYRPQTLAPAEALVVYFRVALIGGVTLAMPIILYQIIAFIMPGLLPHEKRYLYIMLPGVGICFALGVAFASFIMLPAAIHFMRGFLSTIVENNWTLDHYINFVTRVLFWMGIVFQTPLLIFLLAKLGIVDAKQLGRFRRYAILVISVIAAIVTPTP